MQDFDKIIWRDALTLIDFFASWCGPCRIMHPILDRFERQMNGRVDIYRIDIDNRGMSDIIARYDIRSVPTLLFFRRGEVLWRKSGVTTYDQLAGVLNDLEQCERVTQQ